MSTNNPEVQTPSDEEPIVDIPHKNSQIDFVFGDQQLKSGDQERLLKAFDLMVRIPQVTSRIVHVYLQPHFNCQIKGCVMFSIVKIYVKAQDQPTNKKFVQLIFDPGGHLPNSRSSSFQPGENDAA
eukprot:TRINITY_DN8050_c0_g1_i12.p1 TRINITY_DN8050_c0_g1~~TRINITY_DN8050_c0_g1_i12.p1  ORF type:complete len:126 (-),score=10.83 TRINITY_DN8050_c0_g1_i12:128-505(-)